MKKIMIVLLALSTLLFASCENEVTEVPPAPAPKDCKVQLVVTGTDIREFTIREGEYFSIPDDISSMTIGSFKPAYYFSDHGARYFPDEKALITGDAVLTVYWSDHVLTVDDDGTVTGTAGTKEFLTIPAKVGDREVKAIGSGFLDKNDKVKYVMVQEGVEKIEADAFKGSSASLIILPSSIREVGKGAFAVPDSNMELYLSGGLKPDWAEGWNTGFEGVVLSTGFIIDENGVKYAATPDSNGNAVLVITDYYGNARKLVIPPVIDGCKVWGISDRVFSGNQTLKTLVLPEGLEHIGDYAFYGSAIADLSLPDSLVEIGERTFSEMTDITRLELPDNLKVIPFCGLYNSASLKSVKLPANLERIEGWGLARTALEYDELVLPSSLRSVDKCAFQGLTGIRRLVLPEGVRFDDKQIFHGWTSSQTLSFATEADIDESATDWKADCDSFIEIRDQYPPVEDGAKVCRVQLMVTDTARREYAVKEGEYFSIPEDIASRTIGNSTPVGYVSENIERHFIDEKVLITEDSRFSIIWSDQKLVVDENGTVTGTAGTGSLMAIPNMIGDKPVKAIGSGFLDKNDKVKYVMVQEGVEKIEAGAFKGSSVDWIILPSSIREAGEGFYESDSTSNRLYLTGGLKPAWAEGWNKGFKGLLLSNEFIVDDNGLKYAKTLDAAGNEVLVVERYLREDSSLAIPANVDGLDVWGISNNVFANNTTLESIVLPEGLSYIGTAAFDNCSIPAIDIPSTVTTLGEWAFAKMPNLVEISLPDNLKVIPYCAFFEDAALKKITLPAKLEVIDGFGLARTGLEYDEFVLPETLNSMGLCAFQSSHGIKRIVLPAGVEFSGSDVFEKWTADQTISFADQTDLDAVIARWGADWNAKGEAVVEVRDVPSASDGQ